MQALTNQLKLRYLIFITAFACLNTLPFCHRAYWLDEYFYLKSALHVFAHPLFPQDHPEVWFGTKYPTAGFHSHPPLLVYIIWSIVAITRSQAEVILHVAFLVFPILAGISCYYLAQRFTERPLLATLLIMASPAFIVMSHTIMSDVVFEAFLMAAFACYIYGLDRDDHRLLLLSSVFMVLACFTSYQGLIFILLLPLYALLQGKLTACSLRYCVPPFIMTAAWMMVGYLHYGKTPVQGSFSAWIGKYLFYKKVLIDNLAAAATFLGGTTIFPLASLILLVKLRKTIWYSLTLLLSAILAARFAAEYDVANKILFTILAANGTIMTLLVLLESVRPLRLFALQSSHSARPSAFGLSPETLGTSLAALRPSLFLGTWFFVVLLFYITCAEAMRARFLLALIPPLVFFLVNKLSKWRSLLVALFILTWMTGLAIAAVDYKFVSTYRKFADYFNSAYGSLPFKKWGAMESGLRYYLEKVGVQVLSDEDDSPRALDVVIRPDKLFKYTLANDLESELVLVEQKDFPAPRAPIRTESMHDSKISILPFYLSRRPWDSINIYQVSLAVDKLPEAEIIGPRERIYPLYWTLDGKTKVTLPLPINSKIKYRLIMPPDGAIAFLLARSPKSAATMQCRVAISNNGPSEETLFARRFDNPAQERQWQRVLIDATRFANREATLVFEVHGDAVKHNAEDAVGWADLVIGPKRVLIQ